MRSRTPAALAAALALFAGCGDGGGGGAKGSPAQGTSAADPPSADEQIRALLARRARALQAGDVKAYAATSVGAQRARDRRAARAARPVRLRRVGLEAGRIAVDGRSATLRVRSAYAVADVQGRFSADRRVRALRTADGWRVRSETSRRERHPWELGRFAESSTEHFVILAPAGLDLESSGLNGALEAGYARMRQVLAKGRLRRHYLVVVAEDARQAYRLTEDIQGVGSLAAISDTSVQEQGRSQRVKRVTSQRLLVVAPRFAELDPDSRLRVVAHELTHATLAGVTSGRTPGWLVEGIALYVSGDRRVDAAAQLVVGGASSPAARRLLTLTGLSQPDAIGRLGGESQSSAYAYSSAATFYLADRYGRKRLLDLYDSFNDEALAGDAGPGLVDRAVRRNLNFGLARLERDLRRWILTRAVVAPEAP